MDDAERQRYEAKAQDLRADLKRFEGDWAKEHDGAKPGRNDIKQNPSIGMVNSCADINKFGEPVD